MKTTSTITIKYPGHNTQKTAFSLCALHLDTPRREDADLRKVDISMLQVDAIDNAKLKEGCRFPIRYVIHTAAPIWHGGKSSEAYPLESYNHYSLPFPSISTRVYGYPVGQTAKIVVATVCETL